MPEGNDELDVVALGSVDGVRKAALRKRRPEEWTMQDQADFLAHLAMTANVVRSARAIGKSDDSAYYRRKKSASFRRLWGEALTEGYARLEAELLDRALNGRRVTKITAKGVESTVTEISDHLGIQLLRQHGRAVAEARALAGPVVENPARQRVRIARMIDAMVAKMPDQPPLAPVAPGQGGGAGGREADANG